MESLFQFTKDHYREIIATLSLMFGVFQFFRARSIKKRNREQLLVFLDRANYVIYDHRIIDDQLKRSDDPTLHRWLWLTHQAACDLYMNLVDFYLSQESFFTYKDLEKLKKTPIISRPWQVKYWYTMIHRRLENRYFKTPDSLEIEEGSSRWSYHQELRKQLPENTATDLLDAPTSNPHSETNT